MTYLPWPKLVTFLGDNTIQEQALGIVRNLTCSDASNISNMLRAFGGITELFDRLNENFLRPDRGCIEQVGFFIQARRKECC